MADSLWLSDDELTELTGVKRRGLRREALKQMGIPFKLNARNRIIVFRSYFAASGPTGAKRKEYSANVS